MDIGEKCLRQGRHLKISLDSVIKPEAIFLGYVFRDFTQFKSISLFSDEINPSLIEGKKAYLHVQAGRKLQLELSSLSFDPRENVKMFKQFKFNLEKSTSLEIL